MIGTDLISASQSSDTLQAISGSLVFICLLIAIISQLASGASQAEFRFNWQQVLVRFFAVIILMQAAGPIQGYIWSTGKSIGDSLLPGPTIAEIHGSLKERIERMQLARQAESESASEDGSLIDQGLASLQSWIGDFIVYGIESLCVTLIYINYQWLRALQSVFMALLAALAPLVFPASIIPGISSWTSWLKLVISVALWPVVAGFLIKAHVNTMGDFITGGSVFAADPNNFFLNMDTIGLLTQAILFMLFMFSTPAICTAIVYGSAGAFSTGAGLLMTVPAIQHAAGRGTRTTAGTARSIGSTSWKVIRSGATGFGGAALQAVRSVGRPFVNTTRDMFREERPAGPDSRPPQFTLSQGEWIMTEGFKTFLSSLVPKASSSSGDLWSYWITHAESLRWVVGILAVVLIIESIILFAAYRKPPIVIRVTEVGQAQVIRDIRSNNAPNEVEIKAFAKDFIRSYIEISSVTVKQDLSRALNMMTKRFQRAHIHELRSTNFLARLIRANVSTQFTIKHMTVTSDSDSRIYIDVRGITSTRPLEDIGSPPTRKGIVIKLVLVRVPRTEQSPHGLLISEFRREIRPLQEMMGKEQVLPKEDE